RTVPSGVPSLLYNSPQSWSAHGPPTAPRKNRALATSVSILTATLSLPKAMSATSTVPSAVPSLLHTSGPCSPSSATKQTVLPTLISRALTGLSEPPLPGLMSLTRAVLVAVPSLVHSSGPWTPSSATKKSLLFTTTKCEGLELATPGTMSATSS